MGFLRRHPLLVLVAALVAGLVAVNAVDEELTPEARAFFARQAVPLAPDTGWAMLVGFHAPAGEDPRAHAMALRRAASQRRAGTPVREAARPLEIRAPSELLCSPEALDCVRAFSQRPESIADLAVDNATLLARYDELLRSTRLADAVEALDYYEASFIPQFSTVLRAQQVRLSQAGVDTAAGRAAEAIAWLEADATFHRRWLEEAGSILSKMLAVRALSRDFLVAGQVARSGKPLAPAQWDALERIVAPLSPAQRGVAPVLRVEAALFASVLDELLADARTTSRIIEAPRLPATIAARTLRRNATLNFAHGALGLWTRLDEVPTAELARAIADVEERERKHYAPDWTWLYNPAGKGFASESKPQLAEYVYRVRDLDALAATIRCAVALRRDGVAREAAAAYVGASPACIDPYEGKPLGWDAENGELSYRPRSPKQVSRFGGRGERVAFAPYAR